MPAAAVLALLVASAPAAAEEVHTSQATRAGASESSWAPLPARPAAVCLIDSGVDALPDTTNVITRLSIDDGPGFDVASDKHGTRMAMIAAAPYNGWGTVGLAPAQPIVSFRALRPDRGDRFAFDDWRRGITACRQVAEKHNVRVINLSLGHVGRLGEDAEQQLADVVTAARSRGISVVAAAGNAPGPLETPASFPPILSVAAGAESGALCDFAAGDPTQTPPADIVAPGCKLDSASISGGPVWTQGSSHAASMTSGVLAQLYSHRPDLMPEQAEQLIISTATPTLGGRALNVRALWLAAGLSAQLDAGAAARPVLPPLDEPRQLPPTSRQPNPAPPSPPATDGAPGDRAEPPATRPRSRTAWPAPRVRIARYRRSVLTVAAVRPPRGATLRLRVTGRGRTEFARWRRHASSRTGRLRLRLPATWLSASVTIDGRGRETSPPVNIRPSRACSRRCPRS